MSSCFADGDGPPKGRGPFGVVIISLRNIRLRTILDTTRLFGYF